MIYARLTDAAGNVSYICSDGLVLDSTAPVIGGVENGKTYCAAQTVTVDEKYLDTVTVNGKAVTPDENGSFVLSPAAGAQTIAATDKAGNTTTVTVTINDGHTFTKWTPNGDGTHSRKCTVDGCSALETAPCADENKDHKCDVCGAVLSTCADRDGDGKCDLCGKTLRDTTVPQKTNPAPKKHPAARANEKKSPQTGRDGSTLAALLLSGGACILLAFRRKKYPATR